MTSSLVGSEMCIRDRLKSVPVTSKEVADSNGEAMVKWTASINSEMQNFNCLLYTSDAADDM
eukprot:5022347-Prorocentrum_lima.AAC.1